MLPATPPPSASADLTAIQLRAQNGHQQTWQLVHNRTTGVFRLSALPLTDEEELANCGLFGENFQYLAADRAKPQ